MRHLFPTIVFFLCAAIMVSASPALACGKDTNCEIGNRFYRVKMPEGHDGKSPVGAVIFAHGYRGSADGVMANEALLKAVSDLGLALIAVKSAGPDWLIANAPSQDPSEDFVEIQYFDAVIADLEKRFPIDPAQLMMTGFSAGGMITWTLACERGDRFAGFAPMAGTFWAPIPESCPSAPTNVIHFHGAKDDVVPLTGRAIETTRQGNVFDVLKRYAMQGGFKGEERSTPLDLQCLTSENKDGKRLEFCLHGGGHEFTASYVVYAWDRLRRIGAVN